MGDGAATVDVVRQGAARRVPVRGFKAKARRILHLLNLEDCELSVALVGDEEIRRLNGRYRSLDEPTDVLSFPVEEPLPSGRRIIGDVVISVEKATRQARQRRRSLDDELEVLLIHGILHNLGYDHERSAKDEREMRAMERRLRGQLKAAQT
ncbi:MAG: rRNA maturation RNase YbeY [Deltaproteobacteria bacterium]|nr:rRNA maturation RNase YbeY [Deltaproteobacteria bacterium]